MYQKRKFKRGQLKSQLEKNIYSKLRKGFKYVRYEDKILSYTVRKNYVCDFTCITRNGKTIYIEVKGWFRPEDRTKMRAVKADNPSIDIRFLFDKDNRLNKNSKMTYSMWCEKYGFKYAFGTAPKEWFDE